MCVINNHPKAQRKSTERIFSEREDLGLDVVFADLAQLLVECRGDFVRTKVFNSLQQRERVIGQMSLSTSVTYKQAQNYGSSRTCASIMAMATTKGLGLKLCYTCYPQHLGGPAPQVSSSAQFSASLSGRTAGPGF